MVASIHSEIAGISLQIASIAQEGSVIVCCAIVS